MLPITYVKHANTRGNQMFARKISASQQRLVLQLYKLTALLDQHIASNQSDASIAAVFKHLKKQFCGVIAKDKAPLSTFLFASYCYIAREGAEQIKDALINMLHQAFLLCFAGALEENPFLSPVFGSKQYIFSQYLTRAFNSNHLVLALETVVGAVDQHNKVLLMNHLRHQVQLLCLAIVMH